MANGARCLADSFAEAGAARACDGEVFDGGIAGCVTNGCAEGDAIPWCSPVRVVRHPKTPAAMTNKPMAAKRRVLMGRESRRANRSRKSLPRRGSTRHDHQFAHAAKYPQTPAEVAGHFLSMLSLLENQGFRSWNLSASPHVPARPWFRWVRQRGPRTCLHARGVFDPPRRACTSPPPSNALRSFPFSV